MPNVGPLELAIVLVIALIIFGPKKLPQLGRSLGQGMREFKTSISGTGLDETDDEDAPRELPASSANAASRPGERTATSAARAAAERSRPDRQA